jgi:hypothetical protein
MFLKSFIFYSLDESFLVACFFLYNGLSAYNYINKMSDNKLLTVLDVRSLSFGYTNLFMSVFYVIHN